MVPLSLHCRGPCLMTSWRSACKRPTCPWCWFERVGGEQDFYIYVSSKSEKKHTTCIQHRPILVRSYNPHQWTYKCVTGVTGRGPSCTKHFFVPPFVFDMRKEKKKKDTRSCSGPGSSNCCKPTECQATRIGLLRLDHWKLANHFRAAWTCWRFVSDSVPPLFWIQKRFLQDACVRAAFKTRGKTRRTAWLQMAMNQLDPTGIYETLHISRDTTYSTLSTATGVKRHQQYLHLNDGHLNLLHFSWKKRLQNPSAWNSSEVSSHSLQETGSAFLKILQRRWHATKGTLGLSNLTLPFSSVAWMDFSNVIASNKWCKWNPPNR